jgi:glycerol-3-phosphate dehydrogenase (NAD(P)+)
MSKSPVGIIGSGSFGTAIAQLVCLNHDVLWYSRRAEIVQQINETHHIGDFALSPRIRATGDPHELAAECQLIFPVISSAGFRSAIRTFSPHLHPYHILIHATKGLDLTNLTEANLDALQRNNQPLTRANVRTMSEVILEETAVVRVGCLSGPNLATELLAGQPAATVIASKFEEVIDAGQLALQSKRFHVFGTPEILGAEFAGALKNIFALGSGILGGRGLGRNLQSMLITRGLAEMIAFGTRLGATNAAFLGTAGIGDLIATATSTSSRNYSFGFRLAQGETPEQILQSMGEVTEGVRTLKIANRVARTYRLHVPITTVLYKIVFENYDIDRAITYLMEYPYDVDVDFL